MTDDLFREMFIKFDSKLDAMNDNLTDFKCKTLENFGWLPCRAHDEKIKGLQSRVTWGLRIKVALGATLVGSGASAAVALAFRVVGN